jgi:HD-GYP domain-containing protein (c-di-GMP phosphodiesterase class II)
LPIRARVFIALLIAAAIPLVVGSVWLGRDTFSWTDLLLLAALYVVSDSIGARGSQDSAMIALGSISALAALPLIGPYGAVVLACSGALVAYRSPIVKRVFNAAQLVLAAGAASLVYTALGGEAIRSDSFPWLLLPFVAALAAHCVVNGFLVAVIVHLAQGIPFRIIVQGTMVKSLPGYVGYGLFGLLLAVLWDKDGAAIGPASALLLLVPLFVARWAYAQYAEEQQAYDRTVRALMTAVETKDLYTRGHSERVSAGSVLIARVIGMREDRVSSLRYAGMLHDVGKLGVPTRVLQKSGRLTEGEFAAIQRHPMQGHEIVREIEFLDEAMAGIMHHHERIDGMGYPMGLAGEDIPEFARVIAVADAFDSMTTTRSYRGARTIEEAIVELRRCAGTQFDPAFVEAMIEAVETQGWSPEVTPLFESPVDEALDEPAHRFDHDDPTHADSVARGGAL